jgi:hypothetical protein
MEPPPSYASPQDVLTAPVAYRQLCGLRYKLLCRTPPHCDSISVLFLLLGRDCGEVAAGEGEFGIASCFLFSRGVHFQADVNNGARLGVMKSLKESTPRARH